MERINLTLVPLGSYCSVTSIGIRGAMRHRLMDLGLIEGTRVSPLFKNFRGDLCAYGVRGAVIALRREDAEKIEVESEQNL